jgi:hypothetical protein
MSSLIECKNAFVDFYLTNIASISLYDMTCETSLAYRIHYSINEYDLILEPEEVFVISYLNYLSCNCEGNPYDYEIKDEKDIKSDFSFLSFFFRDLPLFKEWHETPINDFENEDYVYLDEFFEKELKECSFFINNYEQLKLPELLELKHFKDYETFLKELMLRKDQIECLLLRKFEHADTSPSLLELLQFSDLGQYVDIQKLSENLVSVFDEADKLFLTRIVGFEFKEDLIATWYKDHFKIYHFSEPVILKSYPEALKKFKKLLQSWTLKEINLRIGYLNLDRDVLPEEYDVLFQYGRSLYYEEDPKVLNEKQEIDFDYPRHIFSSHKAFKLFQAFDEEEGLKNADLSFIYHKMRNEGDPLYKILVGQSDFLNWYMKGSFNNNALDISESMSRALKRENKQLSYSIVKKLINKLYDLD